MKYIIKIINSYTETVYYAAEDIAEGMLASQAKDAYIFTDPDSFAILAKYYKIYGEHPQRVILEDEELLDELVNL